MGDSDCQGCTSINIPTITCYFVSGYLISTEDGRGIDVFDWFTMPGAGALFSHQADIAGDIHLYSAVVLISLAALHAIAALKHHFINKDNTLRKMIGTLK